MSPKEITSILKNVIRPIEFFGDVSLEEVKQKYRMYSKDCHPDLVPIQNQEIAKEAFQKLADIYSKAKKEFELGIYNIVDSKSLYEISTPIAEFKTRNNEYRIYECMSSGDVVETFRGLDKNKIVSLDVAVNESDNILMDEEFNTLKGLDHYSIPKPIEKLKINGKTAIVYEGYPELSVFETNRRYGAIPGEHVAWMLERLLSAIGYLHDNKIVHGNIKPENIYIDPDTHNVVISDYSFCITNANEPSSKYKVVNDDYSPSYVNSKARVIPNVDIYAVGKIAIYLLGGDIKSNAMPLNCDVKLREFIRKLVNEKNLQNDAWKLWTELCELRNEIYGPQRFQKLEKKLI